MRAAMLERSHCESVESVVKFRIDLEIRFGYHEMVRCEVVRKCHIFSLCSYQRQEKISLRPVTCQISLKS